MAQLGEMGELAPDSLVWNSDLNASAKDIVEIFEFLLASSQASTVVALHSSCDAGVLNRISDVSMQGDTLYATL